MILVGELEEAAENGLRIERVIEIPERDITPVRTQQNDYLTEVARLDGGLISLLSLEPLTAEAAQER